MRTRQFNSLVAISIVFSVSLPAQAGIFSRFCASIGRLFDSASINTSHLNVSAIPEGQRHLLFPLYGEGAAQVIQALPRDSIVTPMRFVTPGRQTLEGPVTFRRTKPQGEIDPRAPEVYETQVVEPHAPRDAALLRAARIDTPGQTRESGQIVLRTDRGEEVVSPLFAGFQFGIPENIFTQVKLQVREKFEQMKREGKILGNLTDVEFSHVHPQLDVLATPVGSRNGYRFTQDLNGADWSLSLEQSNGYRDVNFSIRAVMPNGYAYRATFRNGRFVPPSSDLPVGEIR